tara:strand:- start:607 stop:1251 length:645 start_codon:yes stop_codon:yes gene_type:complete
MSVSESFIFDRIDVKGEKPKKPFDECFQEGMGTELMAPLLYSLVRFVRPQTILEIGLGYTTPWLAKGIEDNGEIHLDGNADMNYFKKPYNPQMICIDDMSDEESSASKAAKEILNKPFVKLIKGKFQGQSKNIDRKLDFVWFDCGGSKEYGEFLEEYLHMCSGYIAMHYTYYRGEPNLNYEVIDRYCSVYNFERVHLIEPHKYRQGSFCLLRRV